MTKNFREQQPYLTNLYLSDEDFESMNTRLANFRENEVKIFREQPYLTNLYLSYEDFESIFVLQTFAKMTKRFFASTTTLPDKSVLE
jgi:hypothetical protein